MRSCSAQRRTASTISGRRSPREEREHVRAGHRVARRQRLRLEQLAEAGHVDLVALEAGPGVVVGVAGVDGPEEAVWEPVRRLVAGESLERAGQDHPAEVEENCTNRHECRW